MVRFWPPAPDFVFCSSPHLPSCDLRCQCPPESSEATYNATETCVFRAGLNVLLALWLREVAPTESANVAPSFLNVVAILLTWLDTSGNLKDRLKCLFHLLIVTASDCFCLLFLASEQHRY